MTLQEAQKFLRETDPVRARMDGSWERGVREKWNEATRVVSAPAPDLKALAVGQREFKYASEEHKAKSSAALKRVRAEKKAQGVTWATGRPAKVKPEVEKVERFSFRRWNKSQAGKKAKAGLPWIGSGNRSAQVGEWDE